MVSEFSIAKLVLPGTEIHLLDASHFALDEKNLAFLAKHSV
jgi:hypothetical protein